MWEPDNGSQRYVMPSEWEKGVCRRVVKLKILRGEDHDAITRERQRASVTCAKEMIQSRRQVLQQQATSQGTPQKASNQQKLEEARNRLSPSVSAENMAC